jgi:hypothetical protein
MDKEVNYPALSWPEREAVHSPNADIKNDWNFALRLVYNFTAR